MRSIDRSRQNDRLPASGKGRNLTHGLLDRLGRAIVTGAYADARFPTEAELSAEHEVSRSVTREAVKMLTAKGLVSARPRAGTVVRPDADWNLFDPDVLRWLLEREPSLALLRQFSELRRAIEPAAAALAASVGNPDQIAAVRTAHAGMTAAEHGEGDALDADIAFHLAVLRAAANPFFDQFRDVVATALRTSIRYTNQISGRTADLAAHGAVLGAIERRDADGAQAAMVKIIDDVAVTIAAHVRD